MKRAFLMQGMQCQNCKLSANLTPPSIFSTEKEMIDAARDVHKASKIVCIKPLFVILYGHCLVSNELVFVKPEGGPIVNDRTVPGNNGDAGIIIPKGSG